MIKFVVQNLIYVIVVSSKEKSDEEVNLTMLKHKGMMIFTYNSVERGHV